MKVNIITLATPLPSPIIISLGQDISFNGVKLSFSHPIDPHGKVYKNKQGDEAIINYSEETGDIIGSLRTHDGRSYELETCGNEGDYIFKEFDLTSDPDMGDDVVYRNRKDDVVTHAAHLLPAAAPVSLHSGFGQDYEISVMVYYTPGFARQFNGNTRKIALWIDQIFAKTNVAFKNSRINARVTKFCQEEADIPDHDDSSRMLDAFERYKSEQELLNDADTAALFHNGDCYCGRAELTDVSDRDSRWHTIGRISVTSKKGAEKGHAYAHELGHNLGAEHNLWYFKWYLHNKEDRSKKDNHGHYIKRQGKHRRVPQYRTIMAYPEMHGTNDPPEIPYFSNPDVRYKGKPTGVSGKANNAKTIRNNLEMASNWGDEKGTCRKGPRKTTRRPRKRTTTRRPRKRTTRRPRRRTTRRPRRTTRKRPRRTTPRRPRRHRRTTKRWNGRGTTLRPWNELWE